MSAASDYNLLIPTFVAGIKVLSIEPKWVERGSDGLDFTSPLEIDGVTIEGMQLRGRARKSLADREVIFQLEYHRPDIIGGPVCRIEWRPVSSHSNKGLGPEELRHILQSGSHHHPFILNWELSSTGVQRGELPLAIPINPDPEDFQALLATVGKEFRISNIELVGAPPWEPAML